MTKDLYIYLDINTPVIWINNHRRSLWEMVQTIKHNARNEPTGHMITYKVSGSDDIIQDQESFIIKGLTHSRPISGRGSYCLYEFFSYYGVRWEGFRDKEYGYLGA